MQHEHAGMLFNCDQCTYSGKSKKRLKVHIEAHHVGIRYHCNQCDIKTISTGTMLHHYMNKHKGVEKPLKYETSIVDHNCQKSKCEERYKTGCSHLSQNQTDISSK